VKRLWIGLLAACVLLSAHASEQSYGSNYTRYFGSGANDNDVLFTTGDLAKFDACVLMATTGTVDVYPSLDGTNYATSALSLEDKGATALDPVLQASALRVYGFVGKFAYVKVLQVGATAAAASLNCWKL
jgi:hypothetical protein